MTILRCVAIAMIVTLLTGCSMKNELPADPQDRIAAAKRMTQKAESRAIALVPAAKLREVDQFDTGAILSCSSGYQWTGGVRAPLRSGVDGEAVQAALASAASDHGFTVTNDKLLTGKTRYKLVDDTGVELLVTMYKRETLVNITSASPCFSLPEGFHPPSVY